MQLEDYFEFEPDEIKLKGHRIWIQDILHPYIYREMTAEQIAAELPTITIEQVYATILYYLQNRERIDKYIADGLEWGQQMREKQARENPEFILKVQKLRAERDARRQAVS